MVTKSRLPISEKMEKIEKMACLGHSISEIAQALEMRIENVRYKLYMLKLYDFVSAANKHLKPYQKKHIHIYHKRKTPQEIAVELGLLGVRVQKYLQQHSEVLPAVSDEEEKKYADRMHIWSKSQIDFIIENFKMPMAEIADKLKKPIVYIEPLKRHLEKIKWSPERTAKYIQSICRK